VYAHAFPLALAIALAIARRPYAPSGAVAANRSPSRIAATPAFDYIHQVLVPGVAGSLAAASLRPAFAAALAAGLIGLVVQPATAAERVGSETCRACHQTAYQVWKASPHAKASENLTAAQRDDLRCAYCHAPERARALQQSGPFQRNDQVSGQASALVEGGVGCETCHGAGQYYSPGYVMRDSELARAVGLLDPGQKSCLVCHSGEAPSLSPFDFAAKVKLIDHWTQARGQMRSGAPADLPAGGDGSSSAGTEARATGPAALAKAPASEAPSP
jgi:hypothetical protein